MKMPTPAQRRELEYMARNERGLSSCYAPNGLAAAAWRKMLERMSLAGLVKPYVHGGYEITEEGRAALSAAGQPEGGGA